MEHKREISIFIFFPGNFLLAKHLKKLFDFCARRRLGRTHSVESSQVAYKATCDDPGFHRRARYRAPATTSAHAGTLPKIQLKNHFNQ
jgi:hypothetical protein